MISELGLVELRLTLPPLLKLQAERGNGEAAMIVRNFGTQEVRLIAGAPHAVAAQVIDWERANAGAVTLSEVAHWDDATQRWVGMSDVAAEIVHGMEVEQSREESKMAEMVAQGWISVHDHLPPARANSRGGCSEMVELMYDGHTCQTMYCHPAGDWMLLKCQEKVTHWRPLFCNRGRS